MATIQWQIQASPGSWTTLSASLCAKLESAFKDASVSKKTIEEKLFVVGDMKYDDAPVRRCKASSISSLYWDDTAFAPTDSYASGLMIDAKLVGRDCTAIHMRGSTYDVSLVEPCVQTNRSTGMGRPLHIPTQPVLTSDPFKPDGTDYDELQCIVETLPEAMQKSLVCPITWAVFRRPVVAADGHTYEEEAIIEHLMTKDKSPLTKEKLTDKSLRPNRAMHALVHSLKPTKKARTKGM